MAEAGREPTPGTSWVEVLQLGPEPRRGGRRSRRWALALLLAVAVLAASAMVAVRWRQAAEPTFSRDEVVRLYTDPPAQARREYGWDPDTLSTESDSDDPRSSRTSSSACDRIVTPDLEPYGVDQAGVALDPPEDDDDPRSVAGVALTVRYLDPATARGQFRSVNADLSSCTGSAGDVTGTSGRVGARPRFRIDSPSLGRDGNGGSQTTFRVRIDGVDTPFRVTVVRFGNTLSWLAHREAQDAAPGDGAALGDLVVLGLRRSYAERR